ncbi:hypothetical protein [Laspinema olomoucense]|uniref:hypothetical protein n=1 Tax=Laspinema olomoucense TaxID=3231600 RepID=UPI0021BA6010|nr:hypothetical protein [Laspinema sp. D3a]MCT7992040.1 hypothetical protein [Laspinema sp. D3a]
MLTELGWQSLRRGTDSLVDNRLSAQLDAQLVKVPIARVELPMNLVGTCGVKLAIALVKAER